MDEIAVPGFHPKFADSLEKLLREAHARKLPECGLFSGVRKWSEQRELYEKGRTIVNPDGATEANPRGRIVTWAIEGFGWHNYGLAADIVFRDSRGVWTWDDSLPWEELGKVGEMFGLAWGGRWKAPKTDRPHFEMTGNLKIGWARQMVLQFGIERVWEAIT